MVLGLNSSVRYARFSKGGAENLRITNTSMKIFSYQNQSVFLSKIRGRPKNIKRSSLKFSPVFGQKLGEDQKKRSSLKFSPVFDPKLGEGQKLKSWRTVFVHKPSAQVTKGGGGGGGGGRPQFCILFYANYIILASQRGGHGPMPPSKYAPGPEIHSFKRRDVATVGRH